MQTQQTPTEGKQDSKQDAPAPETPFFEPSGKKRKKRRRVIAAAAVAVLAVVLIALRLAGGGKIPSPASRRNYARVAQLPLQAGFWTPTIWR